MVRLLAVTFIIAVTVVLLAGEPRQITLKVGDAAPALTVGEWIKGKPVEKFEPGQIYVVELWATWCGPCIASIPHLTELQEKYKDQGVTIIGVNVFESDQAAVKKFVENAGDDMNYTVALDKLAAGEKEGQTAKAWFNASGWRGIPVAFIINREGKIAWIGHPMRMDDVLAGVVDGSY